MEPVVDDGRDEWALLRGDHLLLDDRRDDQHVVGRQVLRLRVREVDLGPVLLERLELPVHQLARGRLLHEVVRRREEEALELAPLVVAGELARDLRAGRGCKVGPRRELRVDLPLAARDLVHGLDPLGHLRAREALREDDLQRGRSDDRRGLRLRLAAVAKHTCDCERHPARRTRGRARAGPARRCASPRSGRATAPAGARAARAPALRARAARPRQVARQQMGRGPGVFGMRSAALLGQVGREPLVEALHGHAQSFAEA